jgi:hypothetical protein
VWGSASTRLTRCAVSTGRGQVLHTCSACIPSVAGLLLQQKARCSIQYSEASTATQAQCMRLRGLLPPELGHAGPAHVGGVGGTGGLGNL